MSTTSGFHRFWSSCMLFVLLAGPPLLHAQGTTYIALIPPFHDRLNVSTEGPLRLSSQRFVMFVYRNAVAVYLEADFVNTGAKPLAQELALPSTGHSGNEQESGGSVSSGILDVQMWVAGERVAPDLLNDGSQAWYTIHTRFAPGERRTVKAVFWAETSLTDVDSLPGLDTVALAIGKRAFMVDLSHAAIWNGDIDSVSVAVVLRGGMLVKQDSFLVEPEPDVMNDSALTWSFSSLEPGPEDNIIVSYSPSGSWGSTKNTMASLSAYIVKKVYDELLGFVRDIEE